MEEMERIEKKSVESLDWETLIKEIRYQGETLKGVISDLKNRETLGLHKYGKVLSRNTDEDMLQHLYEELLDASMYIKTLILQRKTF